MNAPRGCTRFGRLHRPHAACMTSRLALVLLLAVPAAAGRAAETVSVAAAANFVYALDTLNAAFKQADPAVTVTTTTGASGSLVAQIRNGAPFDVFLSADLEYPRGLIQAGEADASSLVTFATGRLVLWTARTGLSLDDLAAAVRNPAVKKLAVANPATAPYGRAAWQALEKLGLWAGAQPKLVVGENISQTAQFIETGNADAGFVALSLVLSPKLAHRGRWTEVPPALYAGVPLDHAGVLTTRGAANPAARRYLEFLVSAPAKKILRDFGYGVP
jgi:molybdate transport system substrate-binding protein